MGVNGPAFGAASLDHLFRAVESFDVDALRATFMDDAFVFTPAADGALNSASAVAGDMQRRFESLRARGETIRIRTESSLSGVSESGQGAWVFDQIVVEVLEGDDIVRTAPVRVTAAFGRHEGGWRIAAGYWSFPFETQEIQDEAKHAGQLQPGKVLAEAIADEARPFVDALTAALARPIALPDLYSTHESHASIGSVVHEVFVGPAGEAVWREFVRHVHDFAPRGPMRATMITPDLGWLAANIDIGSPVPTPYRFFYVWLKEASDWRIVVSHDAVSSELLHLRPVPRSDG